MTNADADKIRTETQAAAAKQLGLSAAQYTEYERLSGLKPGDWPRDLYDYCSAKAFEYGSFQSFIPRWIVDWIKLEK
jgi:hypothetical protein